MHYFDNEAAWEAFRAEAESWLGTPYRHLQRCRGRGADCTLFVGQALLDAGLLTRLEYDYYPRDWHEHTRDEYVLEASHRHMRDYLRPGLEMASLPVGTPLLRGDWLAFSTTERRVTNHCGLVWPCADGGFQMLHAINDRGVSFTPLGNWWLRRMTGTGDGGSKPSASKSIAASFGTIMSGSSASPISLCPTSSGTVTQDFPR